MILTRDEMSDIKAEAEKYAALAREMDEPKALVISRMVNQLINQRVREKKLRAKTP